MKTIIYYKKTGAVVTNKKIRTFEDAQRVLEETGDGELFAGLVDYRDSARKIERFINDERIDVFDDTPLAYAVEDFESGDYIRFDGEKESADNRPYLFSRTIFNIVRDVTVVDNINDTDKDIVVIDVFMGGEKNMKVETEIREGGNLKLTTVLQKTENVSKELEDVVRNFIDRYIEWIRETSAIEDVAVLEPSKAEDLLMWHAPDVFDILDEYSLSVTEFSAEKTVLDNGRTVYDLELVAEDTENSFGDPLKIEIHHNKISELKVPKNKKGLRRIVVNNLENLVAIAENFQLYGNRKGD